MFPKLATSLHYGSVIAATLHEIVSPSREAARHSYNRSKASQKPPISSTPLLASAAAKPSSNIQISDIFMHVPRLLSSVFHAPLVIRMQLS